MNNTMKLEQQVVSLELAKQLKELGVKQDSLFYWSKQVDQIHWGLEHAKYFAVDKRQDVSAFTVSELGEMFDDGDLFVKAYGEVFNFRGTARIGELGLINLMKNPDMSAKMLIWLIEEGYITQ